MYRDYAPLPIAVLPLGANCAQPAQCERPPVQLDSPATDVMTDFTRVLPVTIAGSDTIDQAHQHMIRCGVRLLLVVDKDRKVEGVITAEDVLGEGPLQVGALQGIHHDEVLVRHIMVPCRRLQVINMDQVRSAVVGHVVATLRLTGRQHALVVERSDGGDILLRGIFSAVRIARQLDIPIQGSMRAGTFAELEARLMH